MAQAPPKVPAHLVKIQAEGKRLLQPITSIDELDIVDEDSYRDADQVLTTIAGNRRLWAEKMEAILAPLRQAKTAADALKRDVDRPLEQAELTVRGKMKDYRIAEAKQLEEAKQAQAREEAKAAAKLEEVATKEAAARTAQMRERLAQQRQKLEQNLTEIQQETPAPVVAAGSSTRTVKKWRLQANGEGVPKAILTAIIAGTIPRDAISLDDTYINRLSLTPGGWERIASWPGFEVYEDIEIVRRRGF